MYIVFIDREVVQTPDIDMSETHIIGKCVLFECQILSKTPSHLVIIKPTV